ncbi:MAG: 50S ribosomal protein L37ae [archaeon]
MSKTKKVGSAGRFGAKYGRSVRMQTKVIDAISKAKHECPRCSGLKVTRKAAGIWECSRCKSVFAGGAYSPATPEPTLKKVEDAFEAKTEKPR